MSRAFRVSSRLGRAMPILLRVLSRDGVCSAIFRSTPLLLAVCWATPLLLRLFWASSFLMGLCWQGTRFTLLWQIQKKYIPFDCPWWAESKNVFHFCEMAIPWFSKTHRFCDARQHFSLRNDMDWHAQCSGMNMILVQWSRGVAVTMRMKWSDYAGSMPGRFLKVFSTTFLDLQLFYFRGMRDAKHIKIVLQRLRPIFTMISWINQISGYVIEFDGASSIIASMLVPK